MVRIFVDNAPLLQGDELEISSGSFEYLTKVMRKRSADEVIIFNGHQGDWRCRIIAIYKRYLTLKVESKTREQDQASGISLAFSLNKNPELIAVKGTEMGVSRFIPVITDHAVVRQLNLRRFSSCIREACEQCERNNIPDSKYVP